MWHKADIRRYGPRTYYTNDIEDVLEMQSALLADVAACCDSPVPHNTGYAKVEKVAGKLTGTAWTHQCRSFSRWFNPETRQMEGHAHCTCDYCF